MEVKPYRAKDREVWTRFVDTAANGVVFHRFEFLDYHPLDRFQWHHLMFGNPGMPEALLPAAVIEAPGHRLLRSPAGASLGGLVMKPRAGVEHTVDVVDSLLDYARQEAFDGIELGTVPAIYWDVPDDSLEFVLRSRGFEPGVQLKHYVDLRDLPEDDLLQWIPGKRRVRFRKALGQDLEFLRAESAAEISEFYEVLCRNKAVKQAAPVHTLEEMLALKDRLNEKLQIFCARREDRIVAGVYTVSANRRVCYGQYIADDPVCRELEATRFVLFHMLEALRNQGFFFLDLGTSVDLSIGTAPLARFKESLGAVGCERRIWKKALAGAGSSPDSLDRLARNYIPAEDLDGKGLFVDRWWIDSHVRGPDILELGCADGSATRMLLPKAKRLDVVEGAAAYCERLKANLPDPRVHVTHSFYEDFEPQRVYDDIVFSRSLDDVEDPVAVLSRVASWLAPSGRLHIVVQNAASLHRRLGLALGLLPNLTHLTDHSLKMAHRRIYTKELLLSHLEAAGLQAKICSGYLFKPFDFQTLTRTDFDFAEELMPALLQVGADLPDEFCCLLYAQVAAAPG